MVTQFPLKAVVTDASTSSSAEVRPNILIVDDRKENLLATEKVLKKLDANIHKATSGNEALSLILRHRFALVLLDVQMPEMDGFETATLMQEHESMQGVPIIFVTAISKEDKYTTQAAEIGAVDYVFKPINPEIFCSKVQVYLDLYKHREQIVKLHEGLRRTSEQLHQAQKMEAIGNLTGGMAHDFNNLLGVIIGNLDLLEEAIADDDNAKKLSQSALDAALRGADLTRRLLAFARQQPLQPQRIDTNSLVDGITQLLRRILGEDIEIMLELGRNIWPVVADPAQLEASLTNLATNARDAMPNGGRLIINTSNGYLDEDYAAQHSEVTAGEYVVITVTDSGGGIPPQVIERIFEPFFTTKERDKGTGLGLSMVFGFIKQSGGHISVDSEVGKGTTFRLYLPRNTGSAELVTKNAAPAPRAKGGNETVLVVEDNHAMRAIVTRQLTQLGYQALEAEDAAKALELLNAHEHIDLLFTDMIMPGELNGIELARIAIGRWPTLKVVLTSGFPETQMSGANEADVAGLRLLSKPYRTQDLAKVMREVLEGGQ